MAQNITELGPKEAEFLVQMATSENGIFTAEKARDFWGGSEYTKKTLHRLTNKGWIQRLAHGTYMVIPFEAGPERQWSEQALVIAPYLGQPVAVAYWSALHYWHMTEQIPRVVFLQTPRRRFHRQVEVLGMSFRFVTVTERKFFGLATRTLDGKTTCITDREKTLIDAADRPDLCGGIAQLAQALREACDDIDWDKMDRYLEKFGSGTVYKRFGYLIETLGIPLPATQERLRRWRSRLSAGISLLEPGTATKGRVVTRWRIRVNAPVSGI